MSEAFQKANSLFVDEFYEDALKEYNEAISQDSSNSEFFSKRSFCHFKLKNYKKSIEDAQSAITLDPRSPVAYLRKGMALFQEEEYETAKAALLKGAQLDPENKQIDLWLRKCNTEIGEDESNASVSSSSSSSPSSSAPVPSTPVKLPVMPPMPTRVEPPSAPLPSKIRHEWFQSPTHVIVTVFAKGVKKEDAKIVFAEKNLSVNIVLSDSREYSLDLSLCDSILPAESTFVVMSTKVEIKLKKATDNVKWVDLEPSAVGPFTTVKWDDSSSMDKHQYPSSSKNKKDWSKVEAEEEKLTGDAALNKVFKDIFARGSDEQQRAMMKSFTESGGTVLSTNWADVGSKKVECSPPKGQEAHTWDEFQKPQ